MDYTYDFLVIGSGISGLNFALQAAQFGKVAVLTKRRIFDSNTDYAQGGMAGVFGKKDSKIFHEKDTLKAGDGLCQKSAVKLLVDQAPQRIRELEQMGVKFQQGIDGPALTREGGHSQNRVLFAGDVTGREVEGALVKEVRSHPNIEVYENNVALELIVKNKTCHGAQFLNLSRNRIDHYYARATVLATGGLGALYLETTNPDVATGDGFALAYRAGAILQDMEFVQFHPTKLDLPMDAPFLISEALRGEGAVLRNAKGEAFMDRYDARRELATRDIVARAIHAELKKGKVFLDVTGLGRKYLKERFYNIYRTCLREGLEIGRTWIPVTPAAHYSCGGVKTDLKGQTNIKRLYAVGEVASTGVHGANRLASNSLTEGLVYSYEAAQSAGKLPKSLNGKPHPPVPTVVAETGKERLLRAQLATLLWEKTGIVRREKDLKAALRELEKMKAKADKLYARGVSFEGAELRHAILTATIVTQGALHRRESRGAHYRSDYPLKSKTARHSQASLRR